MDNQFLKDGWLYVLVQELSKTGEVLKHGYTTYSGHWEEATLVRPHVPINVILGKGSGTTSGIDTLGIIENRRLQPNEIRKIRLTSLKKRCCTKSLYK